MILTCESVKRNPVELFFFSKATFTKTAIKPKFVQWTPNSGDFIVH